LKLCGRIQRQLAFEGKREGLKTSINVFCAFYFSRYNSPKYQESVKLSATALRCLQLVQESGLDIVAVNAMSIPTANNIAE